MNGVFLDSSNTQQYTDPITVKIVYHRNKSSSSTANVFFNSKIFELSCADLLFEVESSVSLLKQSNFLNKKLSNEWKEINTITIEVGSEKLFYAFGTIIRFLHIKVTNVNSISLDQMRHLLHANNGLDIAMCIACNKLELPILQKHLEEFLITGLTKENFIDACLYASTYSSPNVLSACFTYLKREGVQLITDDNQDDSQISHEFLYNPSEQKFYYHSQCINSDIFDALLLKDLVLRSRYLAPGYLSCGGKPCQYDEMSEDDFRAIGKRKKSSGFKGTIRCYLDKCYDEQSDNYSFHMYREDTNEYILSAVMLPNSNTVGFFTDSSITPSTVMKYIYSSSFVGVMKGNSMGTEFLVYDNGTNPDLIPPVVFDDITRKIVCKITYESNIAGKKPNAMQVFLPATRKEVLECISSQNEIDNNGIASMKLTTPAYLVTKNPQWSDDLKGWTLKFYGRAKKASKRNFQLIFREDQGDANAQVLVCFGKMSSKRFSIDYAAPLSSLQAFASALTCFMKKKLAA